MCLMGEDGLEGLISEGNKSMVFVGHLKSL